MRLDQLFKIQAIHESASIEARYILRIVASRRGEDLPSLGDEALALAEQLVKQLMLVVENFELAEDLSDLIGRIEHARLFGSET